MHQATLWLLCWVSSCRQCTLCALCVFQKSYSCVHRQLRESKVVIDRSFDVWLLLFFCNLLLFLSFLKLSKCVFYFKPCHRFLECGVHEYDTPVCVTLNVPSQLHFCTLIGFKSQNSNHSVTFPNLFFFSVLSLVQPLAVTTTGIWFKMHSLLPWCNTEQRRTKHGNTRRCFTELSCMSFIFLCHFH